MGCFGDFVQRFLIAHGQGPGGECEKVIQKDGPRCKHETQPDDLYPRIK